jgi:predicted RNA methylase
MRNVKLEQFYTIDENADFCISKLNLSDYDLIIEPSAGNGSFSKKLNCLAYDIAPTGNDIITQDYLALDTSSFANKKVLVIGNPPFGRQSSLAVKFINKSIYAKTIAFILPNSFKKESMMNRLDKHIHLEEIYSLPTTKFYFEKEEFDIPCSFFVFSVKEEERKEEIVPVVTDFTFTTKEKADNSIRRVGYYAGRIEELNVSPSSHYFIKWNTDTAKENFSKLKFEEAENTVGSRSLSKKEIIRNYYKQFNS